jgi:hypothetical protein
MAHEHDYGVFLGLDVGKGEHHAVALVADGTRLHDAALPNSDPTLREVFDWLAGRGPIVIRPAPSCTGFVRLYYYVHEC